MQICSRIFKKIFWIDKGRKEDKRNWKRLNTGEINRKKKEIRIKSGKVRLKWSGGKVFCYEGRPRQSRQASGVRARPILWSVWQYPLIVVQELGKWVFTTKLILIKIAQKTPNIWASFVSNFVARKLPKSPDLVTLLVIIVFLKPATKVGRENAHNC